MADPQPGSLVPTGDIWDVVELGIRLQRLAGQHNIHNVFDDGGYKELLLLRLFKLRKLYREGDDAEDEEGRRYEIKTVARVSSNGKIKTSLSVTTEHTLTLTNIDRYRNVHLWIVAVFRQSEPEAIYEVPPDKLEVFFSRWEGQLRGMQAVAARGSAPVHINNPKIPLGHIIRNGTRVWPPRDVPLPDSVKQALEVTDQLEPLPTRPAAKRTHDD